MKFHLPRKRRLVAALVLALGVVVFASSTAGAHAVLLTLSPEPDAVLPKAPTEVVLVFSENISGTANAVRVFDPTGKELKVPSSVENSVLSAPLPKLTMDGSYTVAWQVVSADGHTVRGAYMFHLREATLAQPLEVADTGVATWPRAMKAAGSVATFGGLVLVLGLCATAVASPLDRRRIRSSWGLVVAGTLIVVLSSVLAVGSTLSEDFRVSSETNSGKVSLLAAALALVGLGMAFVPGYLDDERRNRARPTSVVIGLAVLVSVALEGHALALSPVALSATLTTIHVVAAIVWLAGLFWIDHRSRVAPIDELSVDVRRRSPWAMGAVVLLFGSGIVLMIKRVPLGELLSSGYGRLGSVKLVLLAMALPLAWTNRSLFVNQSDEDTDQTAASTGVAQAGSQAVRFRKSLRLEMGILALALIAGSVLAQVSPPGTGADAGGGYFSAKLPFGEGHAELTVDPGKRGMNEMHITTIGADGRLMAGIEDLKLSLMLDSEDIGPLQPDMQLVVPGHSLTYSRFPFAGDWKVTATATIDKFTELSATFDVPIAP